MFYNDKFYSDDILTLHKKLNEDNSFLLFDIFMRYYYFKNDFFLCYRTFYDSYFSFELKLNDKQIKFVGDNEYD